LQDGAHCFNSKSNGRGKFSAERGKAFTNAATAYQKT